MTARLAGIACCLFAGRATLADGLIRSLPEDGRWVKHHGVLKVDTTEDNGDVTLASVGTADVDGKPARWIELRMEIGDDRDEVYKLLIREEHLKAGVDPIDHVVRGWQRTGDGTPMRLTKPERLDYSFVGAMLHAPIGKTETIDGKRRFPWQKGTLEAAGEKGARNIGEQLRGTLTSSVWPHDDVPFGVAGLRVEIAPQNSNTRIVLSLDVTDFGRDAKSSLPDSW